MIQVSAHPDAFAFEQAARDSLAEQAALEGSSETDFDGFVAAYQASILEVGH